jgi:hypothetical protein
VTDNFHVHFDDGDKKWLKLNDPREVWFAWSNAQDVVDQWAEAGKDWAVETQFGSVRKLCKRRLEDVLATLKDVWTQHEDQSVYIRSDKIPQHERSTKFDVQLHGICGKVRVDGHLNHLIFLFDFFGLSVCTEGGSHTVGHPGEALRRSR